MFRKKGNAPVPEEVLKPRSATIKSMKITGIYCLIGCLWILLSDYLIMLFFPDSNLIAVEIGKGLFYVVVTALILYHMIYGTLHRIAQSEAKLKESETLFRTMFEQAPIGIAIGHNNRFVDLADRQIGINPMFETITGRTKEQLARTDWIEEVFPDDREADREKEKQLLAGETPVCNLEKRFLRPDGSEGWVHVTVAPLKGEIETKYNHIQLLEDITERKRIELKLEESERSKRVMLDNLPGIAYRCNYDRDWTMQFISQGCYALTGYRADSLIGNREKSFNDMILPEYRDWLWDSWTAVLKAGEAFSGEYQIKTASGEMKWVFERGQGVYDEAGNVVALEGLITDISKQKQQELELRHITEHDGLTGLYNRRYFQAMLERDAAAPGQETRAVILLSLNRIDALSSSFGYNFSESTFRKLARDLFSLTDQNRDLFRVSPARLAFYIKGYRDYDELTGFCDEIISIMSGIKILYSVGCGIGILEIPPEGSAVDAILKNVSIASERVARNTPFAYRAFDRKLQALVARENVLRTELVQALSEENDDTLFLVYQPILDLKTNKIYAFEALARMESKTLGIVSPLEFIPMAEEMQLIGVLGQKVLRQAGAFSRRLESLGCEDIMISVNVSPLQLVLDDFVDDLVRIMEETALPARNLGIEITESVFSDNFEMINSKLRKIKGLGIRVSIDDFGSGYSSLARERELSVDCVKIDKVFIDKLMFLQAEEALTGDIISMAHRLGHNVVAEGVEQEAQKKYLMANQCDFLQGYLFSKPLDPDAAIERLKKMGQIST